MPPIRSITIFAFITMLVSSAAFAQQMYHPGPTFSQWIFSGMFDPLTLLLTAFGSALVGMVAHWFKKAQRDHSGVSFVEWFSVDFKKTVYTIVGVLVSVWAAIAPMPVGELSLWSAIAIGFPLGFAADSTLNSVSPKSLSARRLKMAQKRK